MLLVRTYFKSPFIHFHMLDKYIYFYIKDVLYNGRFGSDRYIEVGRYWRAGQREAVK